MSENRILLIESAAHLGIDNSRLLIRRKDKPDTFVSPADIAVLVLHHPAIVLSGQVLQALAKAGAMALITDAQHLPAAMLTPWKGRSVAVRRLRAQIAMDNDTERKNHLWQNVVQSKITTQANTLRRLGRNGSLGLLRLRDKVKEGDHSNVEAQAARYYWRYLMPPGSKRQKRGAEDGVNVRLNFGYAVLRALLARAIATAGLNPILGMGHRSTENPFNLADDLMEPYRCMVERRVFAADFDGEFDAAARMDALQFLRDEIIVGKQNHRLPAAVGETVDSFSRLLSDGKATLALPEA